MLRHEQLTKVKTTSFSLSFVFTFIARLGATKWVNTARKELMVTYFPIFLTIIKSLEKEVDELADKVNISQGLVERLNHLEARTTVQGKPQSKSPGKKRSNRFKRSESRQQIARMSRQLDILIYLQLKK